MRSRTYFIVIAFLLFSLLVLVPGLTTAKGLMDSPWPQYRCDARHTGQSQYGDRYSQTFWGEIEWALDLGDRVRSSPAISSSGHIYVGCDDDNLYAITPEGDILWSFPTGGDVVSSPALDRDGTVYVGSEDDHLHAVQPDGQLKWKVDLGSDVLTSPSIGPDGRIYIGSYDGVWYAFDHDGDLLWNLETEGHLTNASVPVANDGMVLMVEEDGHRLFAMEADGDELWNVTFRETVKGSPAVALDGTVYVNTVKKGNISIVHAVNREGETKWTFETIGYVHHAPAVGTDGTIYFGTVRGFFYALEPDGDVRWSMEGFQTFSRSSPSIGADGTVYIGQKEGCLVAMDSHSASCDFYSEGEVWSSPSIGFDNTVYFGSNDGHLYAFAVPEWDDDPDASTITMESEAPSLLFIAALVAIIVGLSVAAGIFGLYYRGSGGWRTDGQVPPHAYTGDPHRMYPGEDERDRPRTGRPPP